MAPLQTPVRQESKEDIERESDKKLSREQTERMLVDVRKRVRKHEKRCRALYLCLKYTLSGCVSGLSDLPEPMRASAKEYKQVLTSPCCFLDKLAGFCQ